MKTYTEFINEQENVDGIAIKTNGKKVKAPKGVYLNVGLNIGKTIKTIDSNDVIKELKNFGFNNLKNFYVQSIQSTGGTEDTLAIEIDRELTENEMFILLSETQQLVIPMLVNGLGRMWAIDGNDPYAWGEFNPEYFIIPQEKTTLDKI